MKQLNSSTILLAFFAVLTGLGGTYALRMHLEQPPPVPSPEPAKPKQPEKITVPLASRDISSGTQITLDDVALYKMTREEIQSTIKVMAFMTNPEQIIGKILQNDLKKGRPFNTQDFFPSGTSPGIAKRLDRGLRAITILLEPTNALIGFAGPGQRVDVLFHYGDGASAEGVAGSNANQIGFQPGHHDFNPPRRRDYFGNTIGGAGGPGSGLDVLSGFQSATSTLVQDAEILALGRQSTPTDAASGLPEDQRVAVTLAVFPREAELLRVANGHGELSLTLRGPNDNEQIRLLDPVTLNDIINVKSSLHEMEIYRGTALSKLRFSGGTEIERRVFSSVDSTNAGDANAVAGSGQHPSPLPSGQVPIYVPMWGPPPNVASQKLEPTQTDAAADTKAAPVKRSRNRRQPQQAIQ